MRQLQMLHIRQQLMHAFTVESTSTEMEMNQPPRSHDFSAV